MHSRKEEEPETFKVVDRRPFTSDGERRADVPEEPEPEKPAAQPVREAARPAREAAQPGEKQPAAAAPPSGGARSGAPTGGAAGASAGKGAGPAGQPGAPPSSAAPSAGSSPEADASGDSAPQAHGPMGPVQFEHLIMSLVSSAMYQLGMAAQPGQSPPRPDLPAAQETIDLLGILQQKTKGNLTPEEDHLLSGGLQELRLAFVEISRRLGRIR